MTVIKEGSERFVNPYNFIPFLGNCQRSSAKRNVEEGHTGYMDCSIKLLSPLFIPNISSSTRLLSPDDLANSKCGKEKWKGYDFFSYEDLSRGDASQWPPLPPLEPVIPGSEIRGAVRSVYEAVFNGCMSSVSEERALSRRVNKAKKPGILMRENGQWLLQKCEKAMLPVERTSSDFSGQHKSKKVPKNMYDQWEEGQEIWIKVDYIKNSIHKPIEKIVINYKLVEKGDIKKPGDDDNLRKQYKKEGFKQGWLHKGESFSKKRYESVFYVDSIVEKLKVDPKAVERLKTILEEYNDYKKNRMIVKGDKWYKGFFVNNQRTLVYYEKVEDGHVYLSPACIGREVYNNTIGKLLIKNGGYQPCSGRKMCSACQVFGMMEKKEKNNTFAYGSKVRVADARLIRLSERSGELFEQPIVLPELGEPKPGAVEFYTKTPYKEKIEGGCGFWTYDYKHKIKNGMVTADRINLCPGQPELRGRKFYWHSDVDLNKYTGNGLSAMKQRVRPMKPQGFESKPLFRFRIYFEQLDIKQLRQLKWALDFNNTDCAHKIGRAKPLGFGSIQIRVDSIHFRKIDTETGRYSMEKQDLDKLTLKQNLDNVAVKTVLIMADWKKKPGNVSYPIVNSEKKAKSNDEASHRWFTLNKGNISKPNFYKVLPQPEVEVMKVMKIQDKRKALFNLTVK